MINKSKMFVTLFALVLIFSATAGCSRSTSDGQEVTSLSEDELSYFNGDEFFNGDYYINVRNQFLSSLYDTPEEINLFELFYCGNGNSETFTDEENTILGVDDAPCMCEKNSRVNMDAVLTEYMGLTLSDTEKIGLDGMTYLDEYDAYYHFHGDTNYRASVTFFMGEREGDIIRLYYNDTFMGDGNKVLTLQEKDGSYLFVSNQMSS